MKTKLLFVGLFAFSLEAAALSSLCQNVFQNQLSFSPAVLRIRTSNELSMMTWNAHKLADKKFLPDLAQLTKDNDIVLIQEAMHSTELQTHFTSSYDLSFSFFKSFCDSDKNATGVMTASRYPLQSNQTLVSPDTEPITFTPKVTGYSSINIPEIGIVHIVNTHGLNFNIGGKFARQIDQVAAFIKTLQGPVIWAGDFNTWSGGRLDHLNKRAAELGLSHLVPSSDPRSLVLDHIFVRGLEAIDIKVLNNIKSSDHSPVVAKFRKI